MTVPALLMRVVVMSLDDQLIAIGKGDRVAFRALFDAYARIAMGIAMRILRERDLAEDAVQEALMRVWRMAGKFDPARGAAKPWLGVIVRNTALDQVRGRRPAIAIEDVDTIYMAVNQPEPPDNRLRQCMAMLPSEQAKAIATMYNYGMSHSELADHLGQPLGTVKSWVRRGTHSLRRCMDSNDAGVCRLDVTTEGCVDA